MYVVPAARLRNAAGNAASFYVSLKRSTKLLLLVLAGEVQVQQARICYGGVAPKCLMATNTQAALEGQPWTQGTLDAALLAVAKDVNITPDAPGQSTSCLAGCPCPVLHGPVLVA